MFLLPPMPSGKDIEQMYKRSLEDAERKRKQEILNLAAKYSIKLLKDKYDINAVNQKAFEMATQFYDEADKWGEKMVENKF